MCVCVYYTNIAISDDAQLNLSEANDAKILHQRSYLIINGAREDSSGQILFQAELIFGSFPVHWIVEVHRCQVSVHIVTVHA